MPSRGDTMSDGSCRDTTDLESFRIEFRNWLLSQDIPHPPVDAKDQVLVLRAWQRRLYDAGYIGLHWPEKYGGRGKGILFSAVAAQEMAKVGAPPPIGKIGIEVVGPTIIRYGSAEQKMRHLHPILTGDDIWCLGFSEPGAGSDLAAITTRANRVDKGFVISGQKVWTSFAADASWCALLTRTEPDAPRHQGLSYFLVPMDAPGIEVKPIVQITGDTEFCEVFFDNVAVSEDTVLGDINMGWTYVLSSLDMERGPFIMRRYAELGVWASELFEAASHANIVSQVDLAEDIGLVAILLDILGSASYDTAESLARGTHTMEFGSVEKLLFSQIEQDLFSISNRLLGRHRTGVSGSPLGLVPGRWANGYLYSRAASIYSGTDQIQLNIIADRVLNLPRSEGHG